MCSTTPNPDLASEELAALLLQRLEDRWQDTRARLADVEAKLAANHAQIRESVARVAHINAQIAAARADVERAERRVAELEEQRRAAAAPPAPSCAGRAASPR